ncbi:hypothetical protein [Halorarius litoreus]|uniref:hypothetical protein n=1 Tax=Halorarius litoreus TaxID=2962676 RepID=UPI0020CE8969|nr:hypothetical protein [Halorarius litoreus]
MNRRQFLLAGGGAIGTLAGGTAVGKATRADIVATDEMSRATGEPVALSRTVTDESVTYLDATDEVSDRGHTDPFDRWARRECAELAADTVLDVVQDRLEKPIEGVGSGLRALLFGFVVTVDHTVTRNSDGEVVGEPNVRLDRLTAVAPRSMTVTVTLDGRSFTRVLPVGVGHVEVSSLESDGVEG